MKTIAEFSNSAQVNLLQIQMWHCYVELLPENLHFKQLFDIWEPDWVAANPCQVICI